MNASDQCIKTRNGDNDGQSKQQIMEKFVKFVPFLPYLTIYHFFLKTGANNVN